MSLQIRRYQHGDREQVLRLHKVALEAVDAYVGPGPWEDDLDDIERSYLTPSGDFLVGVLGDDLAAMGALRRVDEDTAELKRMRVSPSLQRQGLGRQMLHALEARARDLGYTAIVPDTSDRANSRHRALPSPRLSRDRTNRTRRLANPVLPQNPWPCHNRERTRRSRGRQTGDSNLGITVEHVHHPKAPDLLTAATACGAAPPLQLAAGSCPAGAADSTRSATFGR